MRFALGEPSIRLKLWALVAIATFGMAGLAAFSALHQRTVMFEEKQLATKHVVEVAASVVASYETASRTGRMTEEAAKTAALAALSELRYEGKEYFWVQDMQPRMLMHPSKPELDGQDIGAMTDATGQHYFQVMVDTVKANGNGYVSYLFPKPGSTKPIPKISYVKGFAPWGWIIGSGIYVDDVNLAFQRNAATSGLVLVILLGVLCVLSIRTVRSIVGPIDEAVTAAESIASGHIDIQLKPGGTNETGRLLSSMKVMQQSLQGFVASLGDMARSHAAGEIDAKMPAETFPGTYGEMASATNSVVGGHIAVQRRIVSVMEQYARGNLDPDLEALPGQQAAITEAVATVKSNLRSINDDILVMSAAAAQGDFSVRGRSERYDFTFRTMVENLDRLMEVCHASLGDVSTTLSALAKGDLTHEIANDYAGTFGRLRNDANSTVKHLRELVGRILLAIDEISVAAGEIAQGNSDLSSRTEAQAASLEETSSSMEELTSTVLQNTDNASNANELTRSAAQVAERGGEVVGKVVQTMDAISQSSKRIADIIGVIDGIAFQTNILALNAAVEAARAGENGRGFAVVASEVRSLAQRSAASANEIKSIISESAREVEAGSERVREAGTTMQETVQSVRRITDLMGDIVAASQEQSAGIKQVNQAVNEMDLTTQQNAALVEEAAAAAQSLKDQAMQLKVAVGVFKLPSKVSTLVSRRHTKEACAA